MANVTIFNAAMAGALDGMSQGRNNLDSVATDYLTETQVAAAIAGAVDAAIGVTSTAVKEANVCRAVVTGYYSGRSPKSTVVGDHALAAAAIAALWTEAIILLH